MTTPTTPMGDTTLSEEGRRIALEELRETDQTRSQALVSMRDWVNQNPCIVRCRTGACDPCTLLEEAGGIFAMPIRNHLVTESVHTLECVCVTRSACAKEEAANAFTTRTSVFAI